MESAFSYICSCCGEQHHGLPDLTYDSPFYFNERRQAGLLEDSELTSDLCVVVGVHYFIRARLLMTIRGMSVTLGWGLWVSQSKTNFVHYAETIGATPEQVTPGYLANRLTSYPDTLNMRIIARWQPHGFRPLIELEPCDHPLYRDWAEGITREHAVAFAERALHPGT